LRDLSWVLFGLIIVLTAAGLTTGSDTLTSVNDENYKPPYPKIGNDSFAVAL